MRHVAEKARSSCPRGYSFIEFAFVAIIFTLLSGLLLQRIFQSQRMAELAAVDYVTAVLRSALVVKSAQLLTQGKRDDIPALADQNPMNWLTQKPHNYHGEYFSPDIEELPGGVWFFDRKTKTLVYLLNVRKTFPTGTPKSMKFKVKLNYSPVGNVGRQQSYSVTSVSIVQVDR